MTTVGGTPTYHQQLNARVESAGSPWRRWQRGTRRAVYGCHASAASPYGDFRPFHPCASRGSLPTHHVVTCVCHELSHECRTTTLALTAVWTHFERQALAVEHEHHVDIARAHELRLAHHVAHARVGGFACRELVGAAVAASTVVYTMRIVRTMYAHVGHCPTYAL